MQHLTLPLRNNGMRLLTCSFCPISKHLEVAIHYICIEMYPVLMMMTQCNYRHITKYAPKGVYELTILVALKSRPYFFWSQGYY